MTRSDIITVFGGSGFVGRHMVRALAKTGARVRVAVRDAGAAYHLQTAGRVGQIQIVKTDIADEASVAKALRGAVAAINLVGILYPAGGQSFHGLHAEAAGTVAQMAKAAGVRQFIHMSALGADRESHSAYAASKGDGEVLVREAFPEAVILRPSIVFGPEDDFFNRFGKMAAISPILPLVGGGHTKFQPVYVMDVADAVVRILSDGRYAGATFELGGPEVMTFREVLELIVKETQRTPFLMPMPFALASFNAFFLQMLPNPILTMDQVRLLHADNVVTGEEGLKGLADLGIAPTAADVILPTYMWIYRPRGQFSESTA